MRTEDTGIRQTASHANLPGQQAGRPLVRAEATTDEAYPYALRVGDHATVRVPMTAAGLRSLRDALTALLDSAEPAEADDFVTVWARANGATVRGGTASATAGRCTEPTAEIIPLPARPARFLLAA
ncbi:hypothetical protein EV385_6408 [Krasilnikovia cinnamomea]|uniref:Uncharacterized protein n=1 Tax=Krasilnikovia cinnamomea TaxID=349313 RepID=A0A4Q7ZTB7_9ACTN|nr:hypothetical protein [Krasilnikovia cinnamomea]RZU54457.1 hypothetical protein EV385_6408 [Krasilnikovia cinnamomea]